MNDLSPARGITLDGKKLRELRGQRALSQEHLAGIAGVSDDTVNRAERGLSISFDNARAVAAAFNVDVASLIPAVLSEAHAPIQEARDAAMSNIPIRVPTHFLGREEALDDIHAALGQHQGRVAITALHGLRGVGKTVLAAAYAERHAKDYRATWWIRAEIESGIRADLVGLGVRLGWVGPEEKEEPAVALVMERLAHDGDGLLLIYDNAVSADAIRPYLPGGGEARALITSNAHVWRSVAAPIRIGVWPKEIGADFLVARTGRAAERAAALELSELLGGLPLAHEQAVAYCERLDIPLAEYTGRFVAEPARLLDTEKDAPAEYHDRLTVAKTFALAIEAAAKLHPAAEPLIVLCSLLASEPIPLFLFAEDRGHFGELLASALAGDGLDEAIAALRAFALVDREAITDERDPAIATQTIRLHRLVREVAIARCSIDGLSVARGMLIAKMAAVYPVNVYENPSMWPRARRLDALAVALVDERADWPPTVDELAAYLIDRLGSSRQIVLAEHAAAEFMFRRALSISEKALGAEALRTIASLNNLAGALRDQNRLSEARELLNRALATTEKRFGADHLATASCLANLGGILRQARELDAAQRMQERARTILEAIYGADHPSVATVLTNLASVFRDQGKLAKARQLYTRALSNREKTLGETHIDTANSLNNLAAILREEGNSRDAKPLYERSLAICERTFGSEHPTTLLVRRNLWNW
jgi:tetratricopeptide (TPR) repeat protein/transcriptional regulator with XRE-family HTH domain